MRGRVWQGGREPLRCAHIDAQEGSDDVGSSVVAVACLAVLVIFGHVVQCRYIMSDNLPRDCRWFHCSIVSLIKKVLSGVMFFFRGAATCLCVACSHVAKTWQQSSRHQKQFQNSMSRYWSLMTVWLLLANLTNRRMWEVGRMTCSQSSLPPVEVHGVVSR
jgi:hypothetical protein